MSKGAIAAGHALTARAGADILLAGGNAVDAAVAALWMACVCEPVLASPGGGGFAMVQPAGEAATLHDFFVRTPRERSSHASDFREIHADFGTALQAFHIGAASAACPAFVPGLFALHRAHGSVPMADLAQPAIAGASAGVALTAFQARLAAIVAPILVDTDDAKALWAPDGDLRQAGDIQHNPALAESLSEISDDGENAVLTGHLARRMQDAVSVHGHLRATDFANADVRKRQPLHLRAADWLGSTNPPPAAGGVLIALILARLATSGKTLPDTSPLAMANAIDEVDRLRARLATDPDALAVALGYIGIDATPAPNGASRGTTHVSVIDAAGNAVAATVSNGEGNGQIVGGFMLNNMLGEEDVNPGGDLGWVPGQPLASMMAPTLLRRGDDLVALGSGGSNRIRSAMAQVIARLADGDDLRTAVVAPRLHVEGGHLDFEDLVDRPDRDALTAAFRDHRAWDSRSMFFGGVHGVVRWADGRFEAVGDDRREGVGLVV